jgi:hypothetical protein
MGVIRHLAILGLVIAAILHACVHASPVDDCYQNYVIATQPGPSCDAVMDMARCIVLALACLIAD